MSLSRSELLQLYLIKKTKGIKNIDIAKELDLSPSAISQCFSFKLTLNSENEAKLIKYIKSIPAKSDFS